MNKTILVICCLLFGLVSIGYGGGSGALSPTGFKGPGQAGPYHKSGFYVKEAKVEAGQAVVDLMLDTPKGAMAVILGEQNLNAEAREKRINGLNYFESDLNIMNLPSMGTRFNLDLVTPGRFNMKVSNSKRQSVTMIVSQPESPLILKSRITPLAPKVGDIVMIEAQLDDDFDQNHQQIVITGKLSTGRSVKLRDDGKSGDLIAGDGVFTGTFKAPSVKGMQNVAVHLQAVGKRGYSANDFQRNGIVSVMVTQPESGFRSDPKSSGETIDIPLKAAQGKFRISVIYAVDGNNLAWLEEDIELTSKNETVRIKHPVESLGADQALVRLLNFETGGLEEERLIRLVPTTAVPYRSSVPFMPANLPSSKQKAMESRQ